ncbi:hypothetical protein NG795_17445 [Laspinema sp. D3]|nr:hypothetical protein [Laspinema sp. D2c]
MASTGSSTVASLNTVWIRGIFPSYTLGRSPRDGLTEILTAQANFVLVLGNIWGDIQTG